MRTTDRETDSSLSRYDAAICRTLRRVSVASIERVMLDTTIVFDSSKVYLVFRAPRIRRLLWCFHSFMVKNVIIIPRMMQHINLFTRSIHCCINSYSLENTQSSSIIEIKRGIFKIKQNIDITTMYLRNLSCLLQKTTTGKLY